MSYTSHDNNETPPRWEYPVVGVAVALLWIAALLLAFTPLGASADELDSCELAGINDDGGFIDCAGVVGAARIVAVTGDGLPVEVELLVNDTQLVIAHVYANPDGSTFAVVLYDELGLLAFGMTIDGTATASYGSTLDLSAPCGEYTSRSWCR